ncbi:hypothetical protein niasHT_003583 [Heterodera trifolii]|uniref:Uncharacterized protein n=1 Tax=Heterodera trifolii TaxID=157864 RepID=A0ABD2M642_9BILA
MISSMSENVFPAHFLTYAGTVSPPGFYKIIVWDKLRNLLSENCADLFSYKPIKITRKNDQLNINLSLFKYKKGSNLEELSECFEHFYATKTNQNGEFELRMDGTTQTTIFVHMFPLGQKMNLIHSTSEPEIFFQNVMKKNWQNLNGNKDTLHFSHYVGKDLKVAKLLAPWFWRNAKPSDEDAFLLKAYLRNAAEKLVNFFLNDQKIPETDRNILQFFANAFSVPQTGGKLQKTLAKIDGMSILVKDICTFLTPPGNDEEQITQEFGKLVVMVRTWRKFCRNYLKVMRVKPSLLKELLKTSEEEAVEKEFPMTHSTANGHKEKHNYKKQIGGQNGTGVFIPPLMAH